MLTDIYRKRMEFLKRDMGTPDLLIVPIQKKFELLGECGLNFPCVALSDDNLHIYDMLVLFVNQKEMSTVKVALSSDGLQA